MDLLAKPFVWLKDYYLGQRTHFFLISVVRLADSGFLKTFLYQGGVKSTVSWVFEDLKFKISEAFTPL